jgi:dipeptidyl aminopeptidase/acylaminoacyl peptidase
MRKFERLFCLQCAFVVLYLSFSAGATVVTQERTLTPDDLFKIEEIGEVAFSPDGQMVAYVRRRPRLSARVFQQLFLSDYDRADIWVLPALGGRPINITHGERDGSGYWKPLWSPDGSYIAMLSTKGGDNVRLWVWEKATGRLTKLSERGIYLTSSPPFAWVDNRRIVTVLLPQGEQPLQMRIGWQTATTAMREWPKARAGKETAASFLDSGVPVDLDDRPHMQLTVIDVTARAQPLTQAGKVWDIRIAPDGGLVACLEQVAVIQPNATKLLPHGGSRLNGSAYGIEDRFQLAILGLGLESIGRRFAADTKGARFVVPNSFKWSHDGRGFAFIGVREGEEDGPFRVFRGRVGGTLAVVPLSETDPRDIVWAGEDRLLVYAERNFSGSGALKKRMDWWLVTPGGQSRNLTERLDKVPGDLLPDSAGRNFIGVADDGAWRVNIDSGELTNLTFTLDAKISDVAWPNSNWQRYPGAGTRFPCVIVSAARGQLTDYYRVDIESGAVKPLVRPRELARLVAYHPETEVALFADEGRSGTFLTLVRGGEVQSLVEANTFLRDVAESECRIIGYRSLDGVELKGLLLLPPNYQQGKRYPLVTWVYAGNVYKDKDHLPWQTRLNFDHPLNLQLLGARGYAVLIPSMPLPPQGSISDPLLELTKGVLPAIDKVIELGLADPHRLAVMGHSFGGYSTMGLVTQTNRFKAAIAMAGFSDFISAYGIFDARFRYEPYSHEWIFFQSTFETGPGRMGNPPWKDFARYRRNSPIFYADRVQTPLMIIQGDMDFVNLQQGEEFFTALYRQGKRARFVRYWGEDHILSSPANIRDFWQQAYAWLDEFCDVSRDSYGNIVFDGDRVRSRGGSPPLKAEDFARFNKLELQRHRWINKAVTDQK